MIDFNTSKSEHDLIHKIVLRMEKLGKEIDIPVNRQDSMMDITACHLNGCSLDLIGFLGMDDADFGHDAFGIRRYIDRSTGELTQCFLPRCAQPEPKVLSNS